MKSRYGRLKVGPFSVKIFGGLGASDGPGFWLYGPLANYE